ncbi:MFS transporter [Companilactobacillus allii]|uniref:MFS transporter n=1 Tax=Companilactobacillus allii TaxID=1847728 RepID=A0A1P8Q1U2_9LACO|nr:MFS transporter [Companilactobacillus allii]APX71828.1 MFS transporter [Companilactobacillus allii]USQ68914.1 MFS transporter [Companilactobacillus allii]
MQTKEYKPSLIAATIYFNYFVWGSSILIVSQYSRQFMRLWNTDVKGISTVIAMVGIGHLVTVIFAGWMSDRFGRKNTMIIGLIANIIFLMGLIMSRNIYMACFFTLFLGAANSFDDSGAYPALTEAFPTKAASMNSLVKACMSLSQTLLPFIVAAIPSVSIVLPIMSLLLFLDIVTIGVIKFNKDRSNIVKDTESIKSNVEDVSARTSKAIKGNLPKMSIDGVGLIIVGFTISFTFYMYSQYIPHFGVTVLKLSEAASKELVSWYALSSLISVFVTSVIIRKAHPYRVMMFYSTISGIFLILMITFPGYLLVKVTSIVIGFFAAGGIWQVGLTIISQYFPDKKGKVTGYYSFAAALTYFVGPFISTFIIDETAQSMIRVFTIDATVTIVGILVMMFLAFRAHKYHFI